MEALPDLDRLGVGEKDNLIRSLFARTKVLLAQVDVLTARVTELEGRLALNSRNASQAAIPGRFGSAEAGVAAAEGPSGPYAEEGCAAGLPIEPRLPPSQCNACHRPLPDAGQWSRRAKCSIFRPCVMR